MKPVSAVRWAWPFACALVTIACDDLLHSTNTVSSFKPNEAGENGTVGIYYFLVCFFTYDASTITNTSAEILYLMRDEGRDVGIPPLCLIRRSLRTDEITIIATAAAGRFRSFSFSVGDLSLSAPGGASIFRSHVRPRSGKPCSTTYTVPTCIENRESSTYDRE